MPSASLGAYGGSIHGGKLYGWGTNAFRGAVGDGTDVNRTTPTAVGTDFGWEMVSRGSVFSIGLRHGKLYTWGTDTDGVLGNGAGGSNSLSPAQIATSFSDWNWIAAGDQHGLAIRDGKLYSWGNNGYARTGQNTTTGLTEVPTQIGSDTDWVKCSGGQESGFAIKSNGTLYGWGNNSNFRTGLNTSTGTTNVPTQIGTASDWIHVEGAEAWSMGLRATGELFTWGANATGRTGAGTTSGSRATPTKVGAGTDWDCAVAGLLHGLGVRNGQLWAWGRNNESQIGDGTTTQRNAPVQIGSATDWRLVGAIRLASMAIKTNSTLYTWGDAAQGQLANGTTTPNVNSPTQVGSNTDWILLTSTAANADGGHAVRQQ